MKKTVIIFSATILIWNVEVFAAPKVSQTAIPLKSQLFIAYGIAGLALLLAVVVLILFLKEKKKFRSNLLKELGNCKEGGDMDKWQKTILAKIPQSAKTDSSCQPAKSYDSEIRDLQSRVANLEDGKKETETAEIVKQEEQEEVRASQPQTLYADAIVGDSFNKVVSISSIETIYELLLKTPSATTAEFTLHEGNKKQVLHNADKVNGCEKQRNINGASVDIQVEKGTAILQDGKWYITQKAKVKFV
jgi:TolA-binding protein